MGETKPLVVPQVNVNDETLLLVKWSVAQHARVAAGETVCEVETSKANAEVVADHSGVLVQSVEPPVRVRIGDVIGAIGPSREEASAYLATSSTRETSARETGARETGATAKARALAERHGIALETIAAAGVRGTIKESDVQRFLERAPAPAPGLEKFVELSGPVPAFDAAVAANLRRSVQQLILTSVDADCALDTANVRVATALGAGRMTSVLHVIIQAAGRALRRFPKLMSVASGGAVFTYRDVDVAFVARTADGRLYAPVIRGADRAELETIAKISQAHALTVMRGTIAAGDLEGACFTISYVPVAGTTRVAALPSFGQSAILGVSAERKVATLVEGVWLERSMATLTLTYDHALCDGVYAASFLADLVNQLQQ